MPHYNCSIVREDEEPYNVTPQEKEELTTQELDLLCEILNQVSGILEFAAKLSEREEKEIYSMEDPREDNRVFESLCRKVLVWQNHQNSSIDPN